MPTPTTAFADAAAEFGDVDPDDLEAVQRWFMEELPKLPPETIERVLRALLAQDGARATRKLTPRYPERAPLPSLGSSPPAPLPLLSEDWRRILRRLVAGLGRRR
jgi:hypothetical protein